MAACIPTMRPFFNRAWKRGLTTKSGSHSHSSARDPFTSASGSRSHLKHRRVRSLSDVALNDVEVHGLGKTVDGDDAASHESHQGIVRTVEVA
jgi:hypothetical protein